MLTALRAGDSLADAARRAGVAAKTVTRWRRLSPHFDAMVLAAAAEGGHHAVEAGRTSVRPVTRLECPGSFCGTPTGYDYGCIENACRQAKSQRVVAARRARVVKRATEEPVWAGPLGALAGHAQALGTPEPGLLLSTPRWEIALQNGRWRIRRWEHGALPMPTVYRSGSAPQPFLLADQLRFVTGHADAGGRRHAAWRDQVLTWVDSAEDDPVAGHIRNHVDTLTAAAVPPGAKGTDTVVMTVAGEPVHLRSSAVAHWTGQVTDRFTSSTTGLCTACGRVRAMARVLPTPIPSSLVPGATVSAALQLISTHKSTHRRSNAPEGLPVCVSCGHGAAAALRHLLRHSVLHVPDGAMVWWSPDDPTTARPGPVRALDTRIDIPTDLSALPPDFNHRPSAELLELAAAAVPDDGHRVQALLIGSSGNRIVIRRFWDLAGTLATDRVRRWVLRQAIPHLSSNGLRSYPIRFLGSEALTRREITTELIVAALDGTQPVTLMPRALAAIRSHGPNALTDALLRASSPKTVIESAHQTGDQP
ncbi:type I-C CRISPR-associated protein Cas8c/Csd1 [Actinomadura geliboluensis]|uniref:type I-C CRISPR-associated protein Cas8c/Csd1 n=1 Tax=Actinomadura geliboluensis TaxID=882440 RepID=UPI00370FC309